MPYTFGSATDTYANVSYDPEIGADDHSVLIMGWWRPTTLTAGRVLWGTHANTRCEINSTTDELRLYSSHNTTNGQWTTSGADLAVDQWKFLAFLFLFNTTVGTQYWHIWPASAISEPFGQATVNQATAPSGVPQSSTDVYIGNSSAANVAFQGDVAEFFIAADTTTDRSVFLFATAGAISSTDVEFMRERFVRPYWRGTRRVFKAAVQSTNPTYRNIVFDNALIGRTWALQNIGTERPLVFDPQLSGQTGQFIRPDSFVSATNWTGAVTAIDETVADDADFVYSANNTATTLDIGMGNPSSPGGAMPTVRFRHAKTNAGTVDGAGNSLTVTADLYDGTTVLATDSAQTPSGTWTTRTWNPTVAAGVNWNNVRVRLAVTASGGSPANRRGCGISWVEIEWVAQTGPTVSTGINHPRRPKHQRFHQSLVTVRG